MSAIEAAIIDRLLAVSGVAAVVGDRVTPLARAQASELPAITVAVVSEVAGVNHGGAEALTELRVQIDAYAESFRDARAAGKAVQAALNGYRGTVSGVEIQGVFHEGRRDSFDGEDPDRVYRVSADYQVWAVEP